MAIHHVLFKVTFPHLPDKQEMKHSDMHHLKVWNIKVMLKYSCKKPHLIHMALWSMITSIIASYWIYLKLQNCLSKKLALYLIYTIHYAYINESSCFHRISQWYS